MTRLQAIYALASPEARAKIDAMTPAQRAELVAICERDGMFGKVDQTVSRGDE